jgi:hypothetical protein
MVVRSSIKLSSWTLKCGKAKVVIKPFNYRLQLLIIYWKYITSEGDRSRGLSASTPEKPIGVTTRDLLTATRPQFRIIG